MQTHVDKTQEKTSEALPIAKEPSTGGTATIIDNRPATIYQRKLRETMANSPRIQAQAPLRAAMNAYTANSANPIQRKTNNTGLPDNLKTGIENLSGYAMDDVKVHYNSSKPAQLQAHAYAQDTNIHLAPGQEKHLPHEAWHVVQQKQGRVKPTMQLKGKLNVNDDAGLEKEADVMGNKALKMQSVANKPGTSFQSSSSPIQRISKNMGSGIVQLRPSSKEFNKLKLNVIGESHDDYKNDWKRQEEQGFVQDLGMKYFTEDSLFSEYTDGGQHWRIYGDPAYLSFLTDVYFLKDMLQSELVQGLIKDLDIYNEINNVNESDKLARLKELFRHGKFNTLTGLSNDEDLDEELCDYIEDENPIITHKQLYEKDKTKMTQSEKLSMLYEGRFMRRKMQSFEVNVTRCLNQCIEVYKNDLTNEDPKKYKKDDWEQEEVFLNELGKYLEPKNKKNHTWKERVVDTIGYINSFFQTQCPFLPKETIEGIKNERWNTFELDDGDKKKYSLGWIRSNYMKIYAEEHWDEKAVWKIGDGHVKHIEEIEGRDYTRKYNLMNKEDFSEFYSDNFKKNAGNKKLKRPGFFKK